MREVNMDLFEMIGESDAVCITTNGFVKRNGEAVMGRGVAYQAAKKWPFLKRKLGDKIKENGNIVQIIARVSETCIVAFPVKPVKCKKDNLLDRLRHNRFMQDEFPGWMCKADPRLIERSAKELVKLADENSWKKIAIPRPGCGNGELKWKNIKSILLKYFNDRFIICYL